MIFSIKDKIMVTLQGGEHIAQMTRFASAVSQLVKTEPEFPVELCLATELHAAFREESRTSLLSTSAALQEIRGSDRYFRGFLPRKTTPPDFLYAAPSNDRVCGFH
jgi:hypothetical protein